MRLMLVTALVLLLLSPLELSAQKIPKLQEQSFNSFLAKFKTALAKNDKAAIASMTKLPFLFDSEELDRSGFIKRFDMLFDKKTRRCFVKAKAVKDDEEYSVFCGETIYVFGKVDGEYKFVAIGAND